MIIRKRSIRTVLLLLMLLLPIFAIAGDGESGGAAAGWSPIEMSVWKPLQLFNEDWDIYGMRLNLFYAKNRDIWGMDLGLGVNESRDIYGIQMTGILNSIRDLYGIQIAGVVNDASNKMKGIQMSIVNLAKVSTGVQVGMVNYTEQMDGMQFGLLNIIKDGWLPFFPILNISFSASAAEEAARAESAPEAPSSIE